MNKNKGFTLVELLAVVIILALTFMFVAPKMASLIKEGNNNEVRLIEQKALVSAKNYINNYDTNFLNNFINVGYEKTVFKDDLIDSGLMTLEEVEQIEDFRGVKVTLLENDKLEYTISRLSSTKDYTNEELYQMINELREQVSSNSVFLKSYPVGSIYISTSSTNPGSTYGGTWVQYAQGRTLVGVNSSDSDFNTVEKIGGEKTHTLVESELPAISGSWAVPVIVNHATKGVKGHAYGMDFGTIGSSNSFGITSGMSGTSITSGTQYGYGFGFGNNQPHNNLQPYITVYMWKRTA